ncbi:MAG: DUF742 domain-containing protein [Acidimicrobiia bacterium]|nr:DUF742 domain-containing protein [Acidimicrobiia bacterium]
MTSTYMDDGEEPLVRPFFLTRGRTESKLPVEAMVQSAPGAEGQSSYSTPEYVAIIDLCTAEARAVAEVAGRLGLPLGVARVLVSDLADEGLLSLASNGDVTGDLGFLDRIIAGVQAL